MLSQPRVTRVKFGNVKVGDPVRSSSCRVSFSFFLSVPARESCEAACCTSCAQLLSVCTREKDGGELRSGKNYVTQATSVMAVAFRVLMFRSKAFLFINLFFLTMSCCSCCRF